MHRVRVFTRLESSHKLRKRVISLDLSPLTDLYQQFQKRLKCQKITSIKLLKKKEKRGRESLFSSYEIDDMSAIAQDDVLRV